MCVCVCVCVPALCTPGPHLALAPPLNLPLCPPNPHPPQGRRQVDFHADYVGFDVPTDAFIVGMGMDFNEMYRCLPYVAVLKPEVYS